MEQVKIEDIIKKIKTRNDGNSSADFIEVYGGVVRYYLKYLEWVNRTIAKNGHYRYKKTHEEVLDDYIKFIKLIDDIKEHGVKNPIKEFKEGKNYEIDGYHRLVIEKEFGKKTIWKR